MLNACRHGCGVCHPRLAIVSILQYPSNTIPPQTLINGVKQCASRMQSELKESYSIELHSGSPSLRASVCRRVCGADCGPYTLSHQILPYGEFPSHASPRLTAQASTLCETTRVANPAGNGSGHYGGSCYDHLNSTTPNIKYSNHVTKCTSCVQVLQQHAVANALG